MGVMYMYLLWINFRQCCRGQTAETMTCRSSFLVLLAPATKFVVNEPQLKGAIILGSLCSTENIFNSRQSSNDETLHNFSPY